MHDICADVPLRMSLVSTFRLNILCQSDTQCLSVTIVGATSGTVETAAFFSSGGFSNIFPRPSYQDDAVSTYLTALGSANEGLYNTTGRAYPDVSAQGEDVEIALGGQFGVVGGTSCSSPIFASVVGLLNDELIAAGKSPLGFLNPWLYLTGASALNDITTGSNPGCNTTGFPASTGWDPVSVCVHTACPMIDHISNASRSLVSVHLIMPSSRLRLISECC